MYTIDIIMSYFKFEAITMNVFIIYFLEGLAPFVNFSKIFVRDNIIRYDQMSTGNY